MQRSDSSEEKHNPPEKYYTYHLYYSTNPNKKYDVYVKNQETGRIHKVSFGASKYSDYTIHKDPLRAQRYRERHAKDHLDDPFYPGFWSYHILWNLPDLNDSYEDTLKRYNLVPEPFYL
jgi:hypothetical protein